MISEQLPRKTDSPSSRKHSVFVDLCCNRARSCLTWKAHQDEPPLQPRPFHPSPFTTQDAERRTQNAERRVKALEGRERNQCSKLFILRSALIALQPVLKKQTFISPSPQKTNQNSNQSHEPKKTVKSTADCVRFHFPSHPSTVLRAGNVTQVVYLDLGSGRKWFVMYAIPETPVVVNAKANVLLME
jgi:hypothetical protein